MRTGRFRIGGANPTPSHARARLVPIIGVIVSRSVTATFLRGIVFAVAAAPRRCVSIELAQPPATSGHDSLLVAFASRLVTSDGPTNHRPGARGRIAGVTPGSRALA